jgi:Lrp/AsnC family transcriptional regulator, leucine-responsive regulatory protein
MPNSGKKRAGARLAGGGHCYAMTGEMDYLLRVHVEDLQHFSRFVMDQLLRQPGVVYVKSSFALARIKETTALPLNPARAA